MDVSFLAARQHDLRLPKQIKDKALTSLVASQPNASHRSIEEAPFRRMYDFWLAAVLWAEHHALEPMSGAKTEKFISVGPTPNDAKPEIWMLELLLLIAVRRLEPDVNALPEPADVFKLANELAAAGAPLLIDELERSADLMEPRLYTTAELFREAAGIGRESSRAKR
jgi:hypothetical protein